MISRSHQVSFSKGNSICSASNLNNGLRENDQKGIKNAEIMYEIGQKAEKYCKNIIGQSRCSTLAFHNWQHALNVVGNVKEISYAEKITTRDQDLLIIAAYFHDTGHILCAEDHEIRSCRYAQDFLELAGCPQAEMEIILEIIRATAMPQHPSTQLQQIICDADLGHLGKLSFQYQNEQLRTEWCHTADKVFSELEWITMNIRFLECHTFKTQYAKTHYTEGKKRNIQYLKDQLASLKLRGAV